MEALYIRQPSEEKAEDGVMMMEGEEGEREKSKAHEEEGTEASYFKVSSSDEEMDEDSEPEPPPPVNRKKVAFADALGLDLVTVMEFEAPEIEVLEVRQPPESNASHTAEEIYYMSCLFTVQSSQEELDQRLREQSVELESIELLPGTTTLRGTVTVVNLCFGKSVHVRMTLDCWASYFELCAEYVPGSSDKKTDRFAFKYTMVPPFEKEGSRLEFCLRYETSVGTFWANNKGMNYVLFCHRKQHVKEQVEEERSGYKSRGSCLKSSRRRKSWENSNTARFIAEEEARHRAEEAGRKSEDRAETQSLLYPDKRRPSAASIKSRLRAVRLASVLLSQKRQQVPQVDQPLPAPWHDSASFLYEQQQKQPNKSVQVLTYHQIPLLTLDWNNDKSQQWGAAADVEDIWTGRPKMTSSKASAEYIDEKPCVNDMWETFHNAADNTTDKEASVCEVWQAFLNEPSCTDHSGVPESEWLQTAASVSPSNDKEAKAQYGAGSSHDHEIQVGTDTAITSTYTTLHASAACQLLSDTGGTSPANVAMKTIDHQQPAEARVSGGPGDDIAATQDASPQRSQTNSETDTAGECSPRGLTPVSEDSAVDSSSVCHEHAAWEHAASGEIIGAIGRDEPGFIPHTADLVTSSGESETTDMTATPQSQNASATDRISHGARPEEALSSSRGGEVTGTLHNATDDTLAFRGTIRQGTKDGERFVFYSTSTREVKEGIMNNRTSANKVSVSAGEEEIFRPQETEECEISPRYDADEKQREEFRPNHNSGSPLRERESEGNEIRAAQQSQADEFDPNQACKDNFKQSQITPSKFKSDEYESKDDVSIDKDLAKSRKTDSEPFCCTTKDETKMVIGAEAGIIQMLNEDTRKENDNTLKLSSQGLHEQCGPIGAGEELCIREKEQGDSTLTQTQEHVALKRETGEEQQPSSPRTSHTEESWEMTKKDFRSDRDPFRPFPTDKCNRKPSKAVERRWSHSRDDMKGHEEDVGREISAGEVFTAGENVAKRSTPTELQKQPEILERTEEDMSHKDRDERVSIGKMKIDAPGELMMGSLENPQGERENAPAQLREPELSAAVESPPRVVECEKLSEGTEDAITAESTGALGVIESGLVERFGEDLVMGIWKDLFGGRVKASHRDTNIVGLMEGALSDRPDVTLDRNLLAETAFDDAFDSGVFSLIELPTDTNPSLCQGLQQQQTLASESNERSPKQRSQSPITGQETDCFSEPQTHSNSSAHFSGGLNPVLVDQGRPLLKVSGKSSPGDEEKYTQIKQRSVTHQEPDRQIEDCVVIPLKKESLNPSASHKHSSSPSEKSKESGGFAWWTLFYILSHITRLVICGLVVTGFFFIVYLYDFPLFLALYMFSLCWWFSKWKSHRAATTDKGTLPGKA